MAKMNYSKFKESGTEIVPISEVEVMPTVSNYDLSTQRGGNLGQSLANAASPIAAVTDCINTTLDTISMISKCIAAVAIEKQKTEQIRAEMRAKIAESKEQTARVKIQEKEETKRLIITCERDLQYKKIELEQVREEYKHKTKNRQLLHKEYIKIINVLEETVYDLILEKDLYRKIVAENSDNPDIIEKYLHSLNQVNTKMVELSAQIVTLKNA